MEQALSIGHTPGWLYFKNMEVVAGKLSLTEATEKHGNLPLLGISRFDDNFTFRCNVPGAFWFDLQIDFRAIELQNHGRISISISAPDGSDIRPTSHEQLCGDHTHAITSTTDTPVSNGFAPRSFQSFLFIGVMEIGDFTIDFNSELGTFVDNQIKADLLVRRLGSGTDFYDGLQP